MTEEERRRQEEIQRNQNLGEAQMEKARQERGGSGGVCYIATAVYNNYDDPRVLVLRNFRDNVLSKNIFGKKFISFYYKYAPFFVKALFLNIYFIILSN